jgi:hypothetical protein
MYDSWAAFGEDLAGRSTAFLRYPLWLWQLSVALGFIFFVWPFFLLGILAFSHSSLPVWTPLVIFQAGILLIMRQWADIRFKESFFSAVFFPLGMLLLIAIVINGMVRQLAGTGVSWKQRIYARRESAE